VRGRLDLAASSTHFIFPSSPKITTMAPDSDIPARELRLDDLDAVTGSRHFGPHLTGELGEMESLRLQMAMDRMSKMMSTLSNLLEKISDTGASIVGNIK
jgi:hypothetical protein